MEWALSPGGGQRLRDGTGRGRSAPPTRSSCRPFLRGGFWRNFLVKYPEANTLHKKMLRVSRRVHALPARASEAGRGAPGPVAGRNVTMRTGTGYSVDCISPISGTPPFTILIRAEQAAGTDGGASQGAVETTDWDADGWEEVLLGESPPRPGGGASARGRGRGTGCSRQGLQSWATP